MTAKITQDVARQLCSRFLSALSVEVDPNPVAIQYVKSSHRISISGKPGPAWLFQYKYIDSSYPRHELSLYVDLSSGNVEIVPAM